MIELMTLEFSRPRFRRAVLAFALPCLLTAHPAAAQLQLPGAFTPAPVGAVVKPAASDSLKKAGPRKPAQPAAPKVPADDNLIGRPLMLNGRTGTIEFRRNGKDLQIGRLKLAGDQMSRQGESCEVDLVDASIALNPAGRPAGVTRYDVALPACPFSIDILEGAALAVTDGKTCEFKAADCRVDPAGLWGQPASEIGPQRAKDIEAARRHAETNMRAAFKAWLATVHGDRAMVSRIAREQAAFSSKREELCRSYARESQHGYCALVATEARASAIAAHVLPPVAQDDEPAQKKSRKR